jgi:hypothetical protein
MSAAKRFCCGPGADKREALRRWSGAVVSGVKDAVEPPLRILEFSDSGLDERQ